MKIFYLITKMWIWVGEKITGFSYPKTDETLGFSGILKKTLLDFLPATLMFLVISLYFIFQEKWYLSMKPWIFLLSIYLILFMQLFFAEVLWCVFIWNRRARRKRQGANR